MRLHRLRLLNFRQHADTDLVFGPGITGIIGPNGSGKTTLLEAIAWAIYGNAAARGDRESIRNLRAKARSSVRGEMEVGVGAPGRRQMLPDTLREFLGRRPLDADLDRDQFVRLGVEYLDRVGAEGAEGRGGSG